MKTFSANSRLAHLAFGLALLLPSIALAQSDPLDSSFMPSTAAIAGTPSYIWVTDSLQKIRQDSITGANAPGTNQGGLFYCAQNEICSFQVHIQAQSALSNYSVSLSSLTNIQTTPHTVISSGTFDIITYREAYLNVTTPSSTASTMYGVAGSYPDILIPTVDPYWKQTTNAFSAARPVAAGANQSAWIDVHIPTSAPSGYYYGTVVVSNAGTVLAQLPIVYAVWAWQMPSTATLRSTTGVQFANLCAQEYGAAGGNREAGCGAYPGAGGADDLGATLTAADATAFFLDHRLSVADVYPPTDSPSSASTPLSFWSPYLTGTTNSFSRVSQILKGAKLNTMPFAHTGLAPTVPSAGNWMTYFQTNGFNTNTALPFEKDCDENTCLGSTFGGSTKQVNSAFIVLASSMHAASPPMPTVWTTDNSFTVGNNTTNYLDIEVVLINNLDQEPGGSGNTRPNYDGWLAGPSPSNCGPNNNLACPTRQLWSYNDCVSEGGNCKNNIVGGATGTWPNYFIDGLPADNRVMEWISFKQHLTGELYYDASLCWDPPNASPWCNTSSYPGLGQGTPWTSVYYSGGQGDGTLIYPGTTAKIGVTIPIYLPSIRLKQIRDGMQDYEYLTALTNVGQTTLVNNAVSSWITNSYTFNANPTSNGAFTGTIESARMTLGTALHQLTFAPGNAHPPGPAPFTSISTGSMQLNWLTDGAGIGYNVFASTAPNPIIPSGAVVTSTVGTYNLFLSTGGLSPNVTYYFRIQATTGSFNSGFTTAIGTSTLALPPTTPVFSTVLTANMIQFNWSSVNGPHTLFTVLTSTAPNPSAPAGAVVTTSNTYNTFLSTAGLAAVTTYYFQVQAINNNGFPTGYTGAVSTATLSVAPNGLFTNEISASAITFHWNSLGVGVQYTALVSTAPNPATPNGAAVTTDVTSTLFVSTTGLTANTAYFFQVRGNNGGYSTPLQATTSSSAGTAAGLYAAIVYPNPAVAPADPIIRVCPGIVDSLDVTIFNALGRVMNSSSQFVGPSIPTQGTGAGNYCYEYTWTGRKASGVYFAVIHGKASGTTVKASLKFAVVR